jgi:hypothetical protein
LLGRADGLFDFENLLRSLGGSPQATAWFVDLLHRAGQVERAEQVWKSVRSHRKIQVTDEGPLLEARGLLRKGECGPAERVLEESNPSGVVSWVERHLLLAWAAAGLRRFEAARAALRVARTAPYPASALQTWEHLLESRAADLEPDLGSAAVSLSRAGAPLSAGSSGASKGTWSRPAPPTARPCPVLRRSRLPGMGWRP